MKAPRWFDTDAWKYGTLGQAMIITSILLILVAIAIAITIRYLHS